MYNIAVFGNKDTSISLIEHLISNDVGVDLVVTLKTGATSDVISGQADVAAFCAEHKISCYAAESYGLRSESDVRFFSSNAFNLGLCTGWQRLIPGAVLDRFASGVFGWHGSLFPFPNGRGRSPLNWSIRLGGERVYHNSFRYAPGADDGPVFDTRVLPIEGDYIADLQAKALIHIKETAVLIAKAHRDGSLVQRLVPQSPGSSVHFPKLGELDGAIYLDRMFAGQIVNLVRSCAYPFPGAFLPGLKIWRCHVAPTSEGFEPGQVVSVDEGIRLRAWDGDIVATEWEGEEPLPGSYLLQHAASNANKND